MAETHMDDARKNAFRRILYAAMLDFRMSTPIGPYRNDDWWMKPWLWRRTVKRLQEIQLVANWLHNLAQYSTWDFDGFREQDFWKDLERVTRRCPSFRDRLGMYKSHFEMDNVNGGWKKMREWGSSS